jgi:hypothetical protein
MRPRSLVLFACTWARLWAGPDSEVTSRDHESPIGIFRPNDFLRLDAGSLDRSVTLDGVLEPAWEKGAAFGNFTEYEPVENRKPGADTRGWVAVDGQSLVVAFECLDPDINGLRANMTDRDRMFQDDWVCVSIDPQLNQQVAYQFFVNPRGVQGDRLWQINGTVDGAFDMVFQSEARIEADRWTAELRIPFETLRFPDRENQDWGVHFMRYFPREREFTFSWMPISKNNNSLMGQAGRLAFRLPPKESGTRRMEILPYAIATQNSFREERSGTAGFGRWTWEPLERRAGFGVKVPMSSNLVADFTLNPDFSQIESDAGQININNPFALFYDEKRPFFQEGSELYAVDQFTRGIVLDQYVNLFYSRSINDPLVAAKLSGRSGSWNLGITSALDQATVFIVPFAESSSFVPTDRNSWNHILRAQRDLGNNSSIGMFFSDRRFASDGSNTVGALDSRIRLSEKWLVSGILAFTHTRELTDPGLSEALPGLTFRIGGSTRTAAFDGETFNGILLRAKIQHDSQHWFGALAFQDFSPGFRADNGFLFSNDHRNAEAVIGYTFRYEDNPVFTFLEPRINAWRKFGYDGIVKDTGIRPGLVISFRNQIRLQAAGFIFNRENLRGKQFGDARNVFAVLNVNSLKSINGFVYTRFGREINRFGMEGDPDNPFTLIPTFGYGFGVTVMPTSKINNAVTYDLYDLWKERFRVHRIRGQRIVRNVLSYQFTKTLFVRLIGEYTLTELLNGATGRMERSRGFTMDPMVSYKLNAFSVFFLGVHLGSKDSRLAGWNRLTPYQQTVYGKLQYLFQI